jgi:hypothetical protein
MDKEEFHWIFGVMKAWSSAKDWVKNQCHGSKLSAEFLWPPTTPGTYQTGINHFYSCIWTQQTTFYGQGRVSLAFWCHEGLIFSKSRSKLGHHGSKLLAAEFLWPPTTPGTYQTGINHFYSYIRPIKQHCMEKVEFHWLFGVMKIWS